ncbi:MAG: RnfABCDGE type electron transport complex subunit D [Erysipelotrichaceae bacterium]|nr:RnfABCDGE type electron transport complex subunit D [Erysipelotrichaceae bacterium]
MEFKYKAAPHNHASLSTQQIMQYLTCALSVVYLFGLVRSALLGSQYLLHGILMMLAAVGSSVICEAAFAYFQKKDIKKTLLASFPWITPMIIVLMVPINTRIYAVAMSTVVGVVFGKLVFGGFGQNIFNPAAVGRAITFSSFTGTKIATLPLSATPTATAASAGWIFSSSGEFNRFLNDFGGLGNFFLGNYDGALGETSALLILLCGAFLVYKKVINAYVPLTYLGVLFLGTLCVGFSHGLGISYALFCVLTGGAVFGGVFMLTDPVTNPNTRSGKIVFAALAAVLTVLIRYLANMPEGVNFSILLVNILTPVIDRFFDGKSVNREKKDRLVVCGVILASILLIFLFGLGISSVGYYPETAALETLKGGLGL